MHIAEKSLTQQMGVGKANIKCIFSQGFEYRLMQKVFFTPPKYIDFSGVQTASHSVVIGIHFRG